MNVYRTLIDSMDELSVEELQTVASEAAAHLASRAGAADVPQAETEDVDPQEATAEALHRRLGEIPNVGLQTCRKLVEAGYESLADITGGQLGLLKIRGIGEDMAESIVDAAQEADDDVPAVPQQSQEASQEADGVSVVLDPDEIPRHLKGVETDDGAILQTTTGRWFGAVDEGFGVADDPDDLQPLQSPSGAARSGVNHHLKEGNLPGSSDGGDGSLWHPDDN